VESFDEALWQMTPIRAALFLPKACDIIAEDAFSVASQHSATFVDFRAEIGRAFTFYF